MPMNEEREKLISSFIVQCCEKGQVGAFVLSQVRNAAPSSRYRAMVLKPCGLDNPQEYTEGIKVILNNAPPQWCWK